MKIKLSGIIYDSIVDGEGLRTVIFTQGCKHHCKGCHNKETWNFNGGYIKDIDELVEEIVENSLTDKITFSGGDPLEQPQECLLLLQKLKKKGFKNFWVYTGYTWDEIIKDKEKFSFIKECDVLVDGKFEIEKKSLDLKFKGSSNQRIIDIKKSLENNLTLLYMD